MYPITPIKTAFQAWLQKLRCPHDRRNFRNIREEIQRINDKQIINRGVTLSRDPVTDLHFERYIPLLRIHTILASSFNDVYSTDCAKLKMHQ
jgi:hypothetical protein